MRAAVYCGTRNVYQDMIPSMKSLLIHSNVEKIYFLIEDDEFPYELPPEVECINVSNQKWFGPDCLNMKNRCSYMVLLRVVFSQIFPQLDRILTIDNDTIVRENISELWYMDMDDYYLAGCREQKKSSATFDYINMGVAMINLKKWREDKLDERLVNELNTYYFEETEQTAISLACQGHILVLDSMYNKNNYTCGKSIGKEKIVHYAAVKKWQELPLVKKYRNIIIERNVRDNYDLDVIIPHYNNMQGLWDSLNSLDGAPVHITVIDDCSTETPEVLNLLQRTYTNVTFLQLEHNSGPGAARQYGLEHTSSPYVMFLDAGDCIANKELFIGAVKSLKCYTQLYILGFYWWNEENDTIFKNDVTLLHGKILSREFMELYHLRFNTTPECSYSNEDRGLMAPAKLILESMMEYDKVKRVHFKEDVIMSRLYDKDSITQADNGSFYYFKHMPGLAHNAEHIVNICQESGLHYFYAMRLMTFYLVYMYECYMRCAKEHPENLQDNLDAAKYFYQHAYKRFERVNGKALQFYYGRHVANYRQYISPLEPRPNINRFLRRIKE